jgi:hypothetical protein
MGTRGCPEMSLSNYLHTLRNIPEDGKYLLFLGGRLKSRNYNFVCSDFYAVKGKIISINYVLVYCTKTKLLEKKISVAFAVLRTTARM